MGYPQNGYLGDVDELGFSWNIGKTVQKIESNVKAVVNAVNNVANKAQTVAQKVEVAGGAVTGAANGAYAGGYAGGVGVAAQQKTSDLLKNPAVLVGGGALALLAITSLSKRGR